MIQSRECYRDSVSCGPYQIETLSLLLTFLGMTTRICSQEVRMLTTIGKTALAAAAALAIGLATVAPASAAHGGFGGGGMRMGGGGGHFGGGHFGGGHFAGGGWGGGGFRHGGGWGYGLAAGALLGGYGAYYDYCGGPYNYPYRPYGPYGYNECY
jgi:hypothetical protein